MRSLWEVWDTFWEDIRLFFYLVQLLSEHLLCARHCAQCRAYRGEHGTFFYGASWLGGHRTVKDHKHPWHGIIISRHVMKGLCMRAAVSVQLGTCPTSGLRPRASDQALSRLQLVLPHLSIQTGLPDWGRGCQGLEVRPETVSQWPSDESVLVQRWRASCRALLCWCIGCRGLRPMRSGLPGIVGREDGRPWDVATDF